MNNKQLIKVIKALVEVEVAKKQTLFLSKTFPKILEAEVSKRLLEVTRTPKKVLKKKMKMLSQTFENLVDHSFDFLNIDLEGHDYEVLKIIDLHKYKPKLICIEILENSKDKDKIFSHMQKNAFELKKICKVSYFFENTN